MQTPVGVLSNLLEVVSTCAPAVVDQVVRNNPDAVNQKGWNGFTPLHKACLRGDINIVRILLVFGADPNSRNNNEETAFMYACKRGNPDIMHALLDKGADLGAVDNLGRGAMHHSAHGGNVYGLHYLHEVCGVPYDWCDNQKQTALMIVSMHGHMEALKYLLKGDRVNIHHADANGNTALHIAALQGHLLVAWWLVVKGRCKTVHARNKESLTPLDLAHKTKDLKHKETADLLKWVWLFPDTNYQPQGPTIGWYWHLFMPSVWFIMAAVLSKVLGPFVYGEGVVMTVCMGFTVFTILKHQHRIEHVSKWPNPIYAGCFGGGFIGSIIIFYWKVFPYISDKFLIVGPLVLLTPVTLYQYWQLLKRDPGAVTKSAMKADGSYYSIKDLGSGVLKAESFCIACETVRPDKGTERIKHCKLCEMCVYGMDHHCLYLLKCVARHNHRLFVIFIAGLLSAMVLFVIGMANSLQLQYPDADGFGDIATRAFKENSLILSTMFLNVASVIWGWVLLYSQLKVIAQGFTSVFQPMFNTDSGLTSGEKLMNILYFLGGREIYARDPLYENV